MPAGHSTGPDFGQRDGAGFALTGRNIYDTFLNQIEPGKTPFPGAADFTRVTTDARLNSLVIVILCDFHCCAEVTIPSKPSSFKSSSRVFKEHCNA
jgi:hypothetical protein